MEFLGPWVRVYGRGLGPAHWKGSQRRSLRVEVGPWVRGAGAGLGLCMAGGRLRGQRMRPGSPAGVLVPKWTGKALARFPSVPLRPYPTVSPIVAGPLTVGGSHCCRNPSPPVATPQGCHPRSLAFTFAPPSLPPTLSGPVRLEGPSVGRGSGLGSQQAPGGPSGQGKPGHAPF